MGKIWELCREDLGDMLERFWTYVGKNGEICWEDLGDL